MKVFLFTVMASGFLTGCAPEITHPQEHRAFQETYELCHDLGGKVAPPRWMGNYGCVICIMPNQDQPPIWSDYCDTEDLKHALGDDFDPSHRGDFSAQRTSGFGRLFPPDSEPPAYIDIPEFRSVALLRTDEILSLEQLDEKNQEVLEAASAGALAGSAAGLAAGLVMCGTTGPFAGLCISGLASAGLLTGGAGGLIFGASTAEDDSRARLVDKKLALLEEKYGLQEEIFVRLNARVPETQTSSLDTADILISPVLSRIAVQLSEENSLYLQMWSHLLFSWEKGEEKYFGRAHFYHKTAMAKIEEWNADDGEMYRTEILAGLDSMSAAMAERIEGRLRAGAETLPVLRSTD